MSRNSVKIKQFCFTKLQHLWHQFTVFRSHSNFLTGNFLKTVPFSLWAGSEHRESPLLFATSTGCSPADHRTRSNSAEPAQSYLKDSFFRISLGFFTSPQSFPAGAEQQGITNSVHQLKCSLNCHRTRSDPAATTEDDQNLNNPS